MREFSEGKLKSHGERVENRNQAISIAFSEAHEADPHNKNYFIRPKKAENGTMIVGLFSEFDGVTDEEARMWWDKVFSEEWKDKFYEESKITPHIQETTYDELPEKYKQLWKQWLMKPDKSLMAENGLKINDSEAKYWWDKVLDKKIKQKFLNSINKDFDTGKGMINSNYDELEIDVQERWKQFLSQGRVRANDGIKLSGKRHYEGGNKMRGKDGREYELEKDELVVTRRQGKIKKHIACHGTPEGVVSAINEKIGGGNKLSNEPGECHLKTEIEQMKKGKKIKSYVDEKTKIERMIIRDDELKKQNMEMENGAKIDERYFLIKGENKIAKLEICEFVLNKSFRMNKKLKTANLLILCASKELEDFLDSIPLNYTEFSDKQEIDEYLRGNY